MTSGSGPQSGFTLLELIVVLVIMSTILAVIAPRLAGRGQAASLRGVAHELQGLAAAARARAVFSGEVVGLMLSDTGRAARLIRQAPSDDAATLADLVPLRRFPDTIQAEFQPDHDGDRDLMRFRPDGSADGGELRVIDARGGELLLQLVQPLGQLRLVSPT